LGQAAALIERLRLQPTVDLLRRFAECRFLQCVERREPAAIGLQTLAQLIEVRRYARFLLAQLLNLRPNRVERARRVLTRCRETLLVADQLLEALLGLGEAQRLPLLGMLVLLFLEPQTLRR
jgi:hypothetical protein